MIMGIKTELKIRENKNSYVTVAENINKDYFDSCVKKYKNDGFEKKQEYKTDFHTFVALKKDSKGIFFNYYDNIRKMTFAEEENTNYFSYKDETRGAVTSAQITQIHLEDFGMSYVIRLTDGRFIVIDGGWEFEPDIDRLFECLKNTSYDEKPVIAAWIFTHAHCDHYHCFIGFADKYANDVIIEKFMFNFPVADDTEHYPELTYRDKRFNDDKSEYTNIPRMYDRINKIGAPVYTPHTGQIYFIGDAKCEILASMDDTIHCAKSLNATSLVIRMEIAGQVVLWAADAAFSFAEIPEKYGEYLKSDILQVPHHGFQCGNPAAEIKAYDFIRPNVCLLPVSDKNAYTSICTYKESSNYLIRKSGVAEIITGDKTRTITMPYNAPRYAERETERKYLSGLDNCGACTWVFSELSTEFDEDFRFTFLNMTGTEAVINADLFFENSAENIRDIRIKISCGSIKNICLNDASAADGDALYFNWMSLKKQGIPKNSKFAVRFICDVPIVVSHAKHRESYRSFNR